jgi:hypothetical protein
MRYLIIKDVRKMDGSKAFYLFIEDKVPKDFKGKSIEELSKEDFLKICENNKPCILEERLYCFAVNKGWLAKWPMRTIAI